jgi:hypothetical protein
MSNHVHNIEGMEQLTEFDVLFTDDQTLVALAFDIVEQLENKNLKIVDLNNLVNNRYIHVMILHMQIADIHPNHE